MTTLRDTDFVVWDGEIIPGDDAREAAAEARHGGRLITGHLARQLSVTDGASEREAELNRQSLSGEMGDAAVHRNWHYAIDPAGGGTQTCEVLNAATDGVRYSTGSARAWRSVAEGLAKAGGDRDLGYLRARRGVVPLAAFDWPVYQAAFGYQREEHRRAIEALVAAAESANYAARVRELVSWGLTGRPPAASSQPSPAQGA